MSTYNPWIEIVEGDPVAVGTRLTLLDFIYENGFEEDPLYQDEITEKLSLTGRFQDGGGAQPVWSIKVVSGDYPVCGDHSDQRVCQGTGCVYGDR